MKRLLLINMGGTIAKTREEGLLHDQTSDSDNGFAFLSFEQRNMLPELGIAEAITLFTGDSILIKPENWATLARTIAERANQFDGYVVTHGTDSLAYTSSALSWMLGALAKPIVITGAQIAMRDSFALQRSDGWPNLVHAARVAQDGRIAEVSVVFGSRVLRGNRCTKSDAFSLDPFTSPNFPDLARIGIDIAYTPNYRLPHIALSTPAIPARWPRVISIKAFPGLEMATLRSVIQSGVEGCIVEAYSSGMLPPEMIELLSSSGLVCLLSLPASVGQADAFLYEPTYWFETDLMVSGRDMTKEAAITKLMWALAVSHDNLEAGATLKTALAGEMQAEMRPYFGQESQRRSQ